MLNKGFRWSLTSLLCVVLSGCLATGSGGGLNLGAGSNSADPDIQADARLTTGDEAQFFSASGFQACMVAGGGAAAICMLTAKLNLDGGQKNKKDRGKQNRNCLMAGLAICGVAMGANYYLDQKRADHSNNTARLNAMTADVKEDTQRVSSRMKTMQSVMKEDRKRIADLDKDIRQKKISTEAARKEVAQIDKNLELMNKELAVMKDKQQGYKEVLQAENQSARSKEFKAMDAEVKKLERQVAMLENEITAAYSQRSAIIVG